MRSSRHGMNSKYFLQVPCGKPPCRSTAIAPVVPVIDEVTVSVAVMVKLPTVFIVAGKFPSPLVRVEFPGSDGAPPVLLNWTVPV